MCYVSINIKKERQIATDTTVVDKEYKLPNGETIIIGRERFEAPEILFNPALLEKEDEVNKQTEKVHFLVESSSAAARDRRMTRGNSFEASMIFFKRLSSTIMSMK